MTDTSGFFASASRDVPRDQWGRYKLPDADGSTSGWTRATTFAEALTEQFGLSIWKQRQVAYGLGKRPDLLALASTISGPEDKRALSEIVENAHAAAATDFKANMGTAVHQACALAERAMSAPGVGGVTAEMALSNVPTEFVEHVRNYRAAVQAAGFRIDPRYIERTVIVPEYHVAGTFDNLVLCPDGKYRVLDKKTGNLDYAAIEFAVQLALYANGKAIRNYESNSYEPMPPNLATDYAIIAHIDLDTKMTTLYRVNIRQGWAWARLCAEVRDARQTKHVLTPLVTEVGIGAPEYAPVQVASMNVTLRPGVPSAPPALPPSPIQQATATAVDSFWDLPDEDEDQASPPFPPAPSGPGVGAPTLPQQAPAPVSTVAVGAPETPVAAVVVGDTTKPIQTHETAQALVLPDDEIESLAEAIVKGAKSKARVQQIARDIMVAAADHGAVGDELKLNQQQIRLARDIVRYAAKWGVPLPTFEKPRAKSEPAPEQTPEEKDAALKLRMVRNCPTKQGLIEYRANLGERWNDDFQNAARTRFAELDATEKMNGGAPLGPAELIAGATSPETLQIAWRRATNEGNNPDGWTAELAESAKAKMAELSPVVPA